MLTDKELTKILNKEVWEPEDIYLIHHHIEEIGKMQEQYGNRLPHDVAITTNIDIEKIAKRCEQYLNSGENYKTIDLLVSKNVDLKETYEELDEFYHKKLVDNDVEKE